ncbi:MAG: hypothetical protein OEL57_12195 [Trichlorobacter sp.]|uniref:hypothetical protein n=1 Tax=Trichlorobacter sp. TaxID=2911007 RepID=UPI002561779D|nr:hypothetical protein [Trichlorobacter sp.]MDK9718647.1 hypothetical protein [Trichlorobacter sp.]
MATTKSVKKAAPKAPAKKVPQKTAAKATRKPAAAVKSTVLSSEQLVVENLSTLSSLVGTLGETLDVLVQKTENMAYHLIATEEVLAEVVTATGIDLARVNARIRAKIANGTDSQGNPTKAIDIAAGIVSPLPKFRK